MIDSLPKTECTGCNACVDICNTKAITLEIDIEGFWYPKIDKNKCTECGLCDRVCPVLNISELKKNDFERPKCYASIHKNLEVRFDSTSGGLFSALAEKMYQDGGYVGGAIYNEDFSVKHIVTNDKRDLKRLRSSKYLQSNTTGLFAKIKSLLRNDKKILVCGTPCQMAGLRNYLGKSYVNLIIVDFVCRGINSPKVFRKYLDWLEDENNSKVVSVKFKNKEYGWRKLTTKISFANGKYLYDTRDRSLFMKGYLQANAFCRLSCYECKFKGFPRIADISLADFWGIERYSSKLDNDLGTSMVLLNSNKGLDFFNQIKDKISCKELDLNTIFAGNVALEKSIQVPINRKMWFKDLDSLSFGEIARKNLSHTKKDYKKKIIRILKYLWIIEATTRFRPVTLFQFIKYNFVKRNICDRNGISSLFLTSPKSIIEIHKGAKLTINGLFIFGKKKIKHSKLESRLLIEKDAILDVKDSFTFGYGANIEIFKGGKLLIKGGYGAYTNINTTIICSEKIEIGEGLRCGRNVTMRDNNGGHYISKDGYRDSRPIIIGDKVWLGEGCLILPGVTIGDGAIVGARAVVTRDVPSNSIVKGSPAKVTDTGVVWK